MNEDELSHAQIAKGIARCRFIPHEARLGAGQLASQTSPRNSRRHRFQTLGPPRHRKNMEELLIMKAILFPLCWFDGEAL